MSLILHQIKTDFRHLRVWLVALWLTLPAQWVLPELVFQMGPLSALRSMLLLLQLLLAKVILLQLVQADPLVGSTAFWQTRPLRRPTLFWSKTTFVLLLLVVPCVLAQIWVWWRLGFSFCQWLYALVETVLVLGAFCSLVGTLAALTRTQGQFLLGAILGAGGLFFWAALLEWFQDKSWLPRNTHSGQYLHTFLASRLLVAMIMLVGCGIAAWVLQARAACWKASAGLLSLGLLAFLPLLYYWPVNFLRPAVTVLPAGALSMEVLRETEPAAARAGEQILWSHFCVSGLRSNQLVAATGLSVRFRPSVGDQIQFSWGHERAQAVALPDSGFPAELLRTLQRFYPAETLWFGFSHVLRPTRLPSYGGPSGNWEEPPGTGRFEGNLGLDLYEVHKVMDAPLQPRSMIVSPGQQLTLRRVVLTDKGVKIELTETAANLLLHQDEQASKFSRGVLYSAACLMVVYHPGFGEAVALDPRLLGPTLPILLGTAHIGHFSVTFPYPALRARLTGVSMEQWLREARLQVFLPVRQGAWRQAFAQESYAFQWDRQPGRRVTRTSDLAALRTASLPDQPTEAQLRDYIETLCQHLPDSYNQADLQLIQDKLLAIGARGVPLLLDRLPIESRHFSSFILPALKKLADRDHLPALREALRRELRLAGLFAEKHWEPEARDIVLAALKDRRRPLPLEAFCLAASYKEPVTYNDLAWQFTPHQAAYDRALQALEQCPGFDLPTTIRRAWKNARIGFVPRNSLCLAAAAEGLPEALGLAILQLEGTPELGGKLDGERRTRFLDRLSAMTGYTGPPEALPTWLSQHLGQFRFDPAHRRYILAPMSSP